MNPVYVVDILRTPVAKFSGALSSVRPDDLAALVIKKILERNPAIEVNEIEDVVFGAANQAGEDNRNVARMALLLAGLPQSIGGVTVNRLCASGLQSIMDASRAIRCGDGHIYIAGGVESMTRAPFVMAKNDHPFGRIADVHDTTIGWRFTNPKMIHLGHTNTMGETAEHVAQKWNISRSAQDEFAAFSQEKYFAAEAQNKFRNERIAVEIHSKKETILFDTDEQPRASSVEVLSKLKPAFVADGTVTAGNSSGINDGAACMILCDEETVRKYNLSPLAKIKSVAIAGVEPKYMGIGPVYAAKKALQRAGLKVSDLDLIELNEAFASQSIACINELGLDVKKVNVNGGSIAIGHPLGASGSRISATLLHEMKKRGSKYGLATMCIGVGQGAAIIYEGIQ
ncbi:MAG: acetyl-CoA C-acyltransferase [Bacteroidetes bacterium]|nr:acetyl-CoA C-acyltransferase [Bacteroidota bacterium]